MIRKSLLLVSVFVLLWAVVAQAEGVSFGIKGGFAVSSITETPVEWDQGKSFRPGLVLGVVMPYAWDNGFSLQPELLYAEKGAGMNLYEGFVDVDSKRFEEPADAAFPLKTALDGGPKDQEASLVFADLGHHIVRDHIFFLGQGDNGDTLFLSLNRF